MKRFIALPLALCVLLSHAATFTFSWDRQSDPSVTNYSILYGASPGTYTNSVQAGNATSGTVSNLDLGGTYFFSVVAQTSRGLVSPTSKEVGGWIPSAPVITQQPTSATVPTGASLTLTCLATGTNLFWQWFKDGGSIPGATTPSLIFQSVAWQNNGTYFCSITNIAGAVNSVNAVVYAIPPPTQNFRRTGASQ